MVKNDKLNKSYLIVAWWASIICFVGIGLWATIAIHPHNSVSERSSRGLVANRQMPITPTWYKPVYYLFFNGNNSYGIIPGNQNLNVHQFSVSFWAKTQGPNHYSFDRPIEMLQWTKKAGDHSIFYGWSFDADNISRVGNGKLRFTVGNDLGNLYITLPLTISNNSWTHIVGTFNGTALNLYRNSILMSSSPIKGSYAYPPSPLPIRIAVGFLPHHYWTGDLSDIQVYSRPLSQSEIKSLFYGHHISNGLIGWWKLNEGSGTSILDSSGNGNKGIIHNSLWRK